MSRYGRMRASFDSDASLGNSPPMSPPRHGHPVYFVQSPSRDSVQDVDSLSQSFSRATPRESPLASPMHHKHFKNASTDSIPFSAHTPKPGSRRVLPQPNFVGGGKPKKSYRPWAHGTILEEEEGTEGEKKKKLSRVCLVWIAIFFTIFMFFAGALLFWLFTMPKAPHVTVQSASFSYFGLDDGVDNSGVQTMVVSLNSTATLQMYNPSRFFGYHVKDSPMGLKYLDLPIAGGVLNSFYLEKSSTKKVTVAISSDKQFLHGAGPSFNDRYSTPGAGVELKLDGTVFTRAYVMGQMLKNKFSNKVACTFKFASGGQTQWKVQQLSCQYAS
ncbi:uncharacterized protein [Physcomitrium patens]|uniref:Late embryogenesis abundant protein LEA-2 subgroup domain-containing protein n=1 Tax=Physcomitrium patens TaxID=3218 RepID=A9S656_PHYPA|nr:uncharacterized protein LOC112288018 [Physcomitrium patens]XP_024387533.1 uncharacterized protein LOC112288018 [Physcomitrium patens]XP_024387534.1 uncharacterized protein LOC112288018 [Physcomitrium patens]PNR46332.1 hypothetical protein PHYPA_013451 [Physcomitrium patens]|eukprot:XP_024387532.1 uncharacterized protein LOC112288018 [Physcomitrella patens]